MKEIYRTNDIVRLSWLQARLADAGFESLVLDDLSGNVFGGIGDIGRRLMVAGEDAAQARALIETLEAELEEGEP